MAIKIAGFMSFELSRTGAAYASLSVFDHLPEGSQALYSSCHLPYEGYNPRKSTPKSEIPGGY